MIFISWLNQELILLMWKKLLLINVAIIIDIYFYLQLPLSVDAYWNSPVINVDFDDSSCINTNEAINVTSSLVVICNDGYINEEKSSDLV